MKTSEAREQGTGAEPTEETGPSRDESLERLLSQVESAAPAAAPAKERAAAEAPPGLRMARVLSMKEGGVQIAWRGRTAPVEAELAEGREHVGLVGEQREQGLDHLHAHARHAVRQARRL